MLLVVFREGARFVGVRSRRFKGSKALKLSLLVILISTLSLELRHFRENPSTKGPLKDINLSDATITQQYHM